MDRDFIIINYNDLLVKYKCGTIMQKNDMPYILKRSQSYVHA